LPDAEAFRALFAAVNTGHDPAGGFTRPPWSGPLQAAEQAAVRFATEAGMAATRDAAGNIWLTDPEAPPRGLVATGSHLDTVPCGGAFDGALGVVSALIAVRSLRIERAAGYRRLAVVVFVDEEGWRFGTPMFGSRMLTGGYHDDVLARVDRDGMRLGDVCPPHPAGAYGGYERLDVFVEIHIEQGRALAPQAVALGIATGLAARSRFEWEALGTANHAGTTPMPDRGDALVTAAAFVLAADHAARAEPGAVATVGQLTVEPGGSNVIPGRVTGSLDLRAATVAGRDRVRNAITTACPDVTLHERSSDAGVAFDQHVRHALAAAAAATGSATADLASFAGHDAGALQAAGVPAGMLFVRSPTGVSHNPDEYAAETDCLAAVSVLGGALRTLVV
jgi:beta-ureidopropionase / N-carbamoyl-L-amino-acid hydrolase